MVLFVRHKSLAPVTVPAVAQYSAEWPVWQSSESVFGLFATLIYNAITILREEAISMANKEQKPEKKEKKQKKDKKQKKA